MSVQKLFDEPVKTVRQKDVTSNITAKRSVFTLRVVSREVLSDQTGWRYGLYGGTYYTDPSGPGSYEQGKQRS